MNNKYLKSILNCFDNYQKDYYKECSLIDILLSDSWNHSILIICGKTKEELDYYELNDIYAYRTTLHYPYCITVKYKLGTTREELIVLLQNAIDAAIDARKRTEHKALQS